LQHSLFLTDKTADPKISGYILPEASHKVVTNNACPGSILPAKTAGCMIDKILVESEHQPRFSDFPILE
jgi:hypothetical protein